MDPDHAIVAAAADAESGLPHGDGRAAERIARFDWSTTPLGPVAGWPAGLGTAVSLVVDARFAGALVWGRSLTTIPNDRFDLILGDALGRSFDSLWDGRWASIEPIVEQAFAGHATSAEDFPLTVMHGGRAETRHFTFSCSAVRDTTGAVAGVLVTIIEMTRRAEQRVAEQQLAEAEDRLRQAQKMEVFGQLTGGIAHDFNNLLQAVSGSLEMLGRKHVHNDDGHRLLRLGGQALDRAAHLTRQLLAFARKQSLEVRSIDSSTAMATAIELARRSLPENITISQRLQAAAWPLQSDANQLDVAMLNLIINARDAMPDGGSIVVSTNNVVAPAADLPNDLAAGPYVQIAVVDSGTGMSEDVLARVFEPFFTTKGVGKGTGLGLSQVYGFAHQSGGSVAISSAVGHGTTVRIFLPRAETDEAMTVDDPDHGVWRGRETVLVVDDDRDVRDLAVACLEEYGYRILEAGSGVECLELLGREASVDLLLIDYAMPEMNGAETVRLARRIRPGLEVLFITGYADLRALREHVGPNAILQKPFKLAQLAERVASGLARRAGAAATVP